MSIMNSTNETCDNTHDVFCMFMRSASAVHARFMRGIVNDDGAWGHDPVLMIEQNS